VQLRFQSNFFEVNVSLYIWTLKANGVLYLLDKNEKYFLISNYLPGPPTDILKKKVKISKI
jgi:hypothetical protein